MGFKERYLEEDEDLQQAAEHAFNTYIQKSPPEEDSKETVDFLLKQKINPAGARTTLANLASGVGKNMDSDEALSIYNKAESGKNTIANSYSLQDFFEKNTNSSNPQVDNLMRGLGKNPDGFQMSDETIDIIKQKEFTPENNSFVKRYFNQRFGDNTGVLQDDEVYPAISLYGKFGPQEIRDIASEWRAEKFGEDDPSTIVYKHALETGKFPYESPEEFDMKHESVMTQLQNELQNFINNGGKESDFRDYIQKNDPELFEDVGRVEKDLETKQSMLRQIRRFEEIEKIGKKYMK